MWQTPFKYTSKLFSFKPRQCNPHWHHWAANTTCCTCTTWKKINTSEIRQYVASTLLSEVTHLGFGVECCGLQCLPDRMSQLEVRYPTPHVVHGVLWCCLCACIPTVTTFLFSQLHDLLEAGTDVLLTDLWRQTTRSGRTFTCMCDANDMCAFCDIRIIVGKKGMGTGNMCASHDDASGWSMCDLENPRVALELLPDFRSL